MTHSDTWQSTHGTLAPRPTQFVSLQERSPDRSNESLAQVLIVESTRETRASTADDLAQFGFQVEEIDGGVAALSLLKHRSFDLVLLAADIVDMDFLDFLDGLKSDPRVGPVPVLILSAPGIDPSRMRQAVTRGACDVIRRPADAEILAHRVRSQIESRRTLQAHRDHLTRFERLAEAARILEKGRFHPAALRLDEVATRPDELGRLAVVFAELAHQAYDRELTLLRTIRTLRGGILLLAQGVLWGLVVPLSVLIYRENPLTLGVSLWTNVIAGLICCAWAVAAGKSLRISYAHLKFLLVWATIFGCSSIVLFEAAGRVTGIALSIVIALQGFMVFAAAALMRIEPASLRRFLGLGLGLLGMLALLFMRDEGGAVLDWRWILFAMLVPILYGAIDLLLAMKHPPDLDPVVSSGLVLLLSGLGFVPFALLYGHYYTPSPDLSTSNLLIIMIGFCIGVSTVIYIIMVALAGAVFASQSAYFITFAGIAWSVIILGEPLTLWTAMTLVTIIAGLALVGPKDETGTVEVEFRKRRERRRWR